MAKEKTYKTLIQIDDEYRIEQDQYNSNLIRHRMSEETGKERDECIGHYANIRNALWAYVKDKRLTIDTCKSIGDYIKKIEEMDSSCIDTITKILQ